MRGIRATLVYCLGQHKLLLRWRHVNDALDVLISVVNHDNLPVLLDCLGSLPRACEAHSWKCVVVDNVAGTEAPDVIAASYPEIELIQNTTPRGFGANHNIAAARAPSARYVLALNDDTLLGPGSIDRLIDRMDSNPSLGAVGPSMVDETGERIRTMYPFPTARDLTIAALRARDRAHVASSQGWLNAACLLLRTSAFVEVGRWDERFFLFFEDTDLSKRLRDAGWELAVELDARIVHANHSTVGRVGSRSEFHNLRSQYLYLRKHHGAIIAIATSYGVRLALAVRAIKAGVETLLNRNTASFALMLLQLARFNPRRDGQ
jgi:N-acetylglucosaminyl-diphospho-decaprenol L-rhamnosyltransferase